MNLDLTSLMMSQHVCSPAREECPACRVLHDHYASNAMARGHHTECDLVTTWRNWPTIMGRPHCNCGRTS